MLKVPTPIIKNPKIKSETQINSTYTYDPMIEENRDGDMSSVLMIRLSKIINQLSNEDHIRLYKLLRTYMDSNFFAPNNTGTYFNLNGLPNHVKWELYRNAQFSKQNQVRTTVIRSAVSEHVEHVNNLSEQLRVSGGKTNVDTYPNANPSEPEKVARMKKFQKLTFGL